MTQPTTLPTCGVNGLGWYGVNDTPNALAHCGSVLGCRPPSRQECRECASPLSSSLSTTRCSRRGGYSDGVDDAARSSVDDLVERPHDNRLDVWMSPRIALNQRALARRATSLLAHVAITVDTTYRARCRSRRHDGTSLSALVTKLTNRCAWSPANAVSVFNHTPPAAFAPAVANRMTATCG